MGADTKREIARLERAYMKAHKAELRAVDALPEKPSEAQFARCWRLADAANEARAALTTALDRSV